MPGGRGGRGQAWAGAGAAPRWWLVALVLGLHLLAVDLLVQDRLGAGNSPDRPQPMDVAFVRDLAQQAPVAARPGPVAVAPTAPRLAAVADARQAQRPRPAASAASAAAPAEAPPLPPASATVPAAGLDMAAPASADPPGKVLADMAAPASAAVGAVGPAAPPAPVELSAASTAPAQAATAREATASAASAATATGFAWPPSTRLSFKLQGHYHGPVEGVARVEWVRQGSRYQVRLDSHAGPLFSRKVLSEGELTEHGLAPQRFSGEQKVLFAKPRRWSLAFGAEQTTLADGRSVPAQPGQQDEASQFVQITWLFSTQPELLQVGRSVAFPLAISRRLERWTFDVVAQETLRLPMGEVATFHVKPRREAAAGDMSAEMWIAPSLQYLPVRILIRQRDEHFVDLSLARAPQQAAE